MLLNNEHEIVVKALHVSDDPLLVRMTYHNANRHFLTQSQPIRDCFNLDLHFPLGYTSPRKKNPIAYDACSLFNFSQECQIEW